MELRQWYGRRIKSLISAVQVDSLRRLLGVRRINNTPKAPIELRVVTKGLDESFNKSVLRWFGNIERMENNRTTKTVHVGECTGSCSLGHL